MRKIHILILFFAAVTALFGQAERARTTLTTRGFDLTVTAPVLEKRFEKFSAVTVVDYASAARSDAPGTFRIPADEFFIALPGGAKPDFSFAVLQSSTIPNAVPKLNPKMIKTSDSTYAAVEAEYSDVVPAQTQSAFEVLNYFHWRDLYCAHVRVRLAEYKQSGNSIGELLSYKISVSFKDGAALNSEPLQSRSQLEASFAEMLANRDIAEQFRTAAPLPAADTTGSWINYAGQYIKMGVGEDRLYRLTKPNLSALNLPSGIDPSTFRLFRGGIELPIFVQTQQPGVFGENDFIEFFGQKNYEPFSPRTVNPDSLPYNTFLNKYSDTSYYFLTWGGQPGLRAGNAQAATGGGDTLSYYNDFIHYEPNSVYQQLTDDLIKSQDPEKLAEKAWFGAFVNPGSTRYTISLSNIVPGKTAAAYARLSSGASNRIPNAHTVTLGLKVFPAVSADTLLFGIETKSINRFQRVVLGGEFPSDSLKNGNNVLTIRNYANGTEPNYLLFDWYEIEYPRSLRAINDSLYFEIRDALPLQPRPIKVLNVSAPADSFVLYRVKPSFAKVTNISKAGTALIFNDTVGQGYAYCLMPVKKLIAPPVLRFKQFVNLRAPARKAAYIGITHQKLFSSARAYLGFIKQSYAVDTALVSVDDIYDEFSYGNPDPAAIRAFLASAYANWQAPKPAYLILLGSASYDYKRYVFKATGRELNMNLVPSFGEPVSDTWFTMFEENAPRIQQMLVGRLPARTEGELNYYLEKHRAHFNQRLDAWNKRSLFFSGGSGDSSALAALRAVNTNIINSYVTPPPFSLNYDHFYKTVSPLSDFGPFEPLYIRRAIEAGGLFISYLGHSGTRTWDNSIADPNQLLNRSNKGSLITDFGCSTAKFAEADVESFGGLFVNSGQTVAYIGNTSYGFSGTSYTAPTYFYEKILRDTVTRVSDAHFKSKLKLFSVFGSSGDVRVFSLTNTLLGDPILQIKLPVKPNLSLTANDVSLMGQSPTDQDDSVKVFVRFENSGSVSSDSFSVRITHAFRAGGRDTSVTSLLRKRVPAAADTLSISLPVKNAPGEHTLSIVLDPGNAIAELYEDDNAAQIKFSVASLVLKLIAFGDYGAQQNPAVKVLSPKSLWNGPQPQLIVQYDSSESFTNPSQFTAAPDTFFTKVTFPSLPAQKRFWVRIRANTPDTLWSNAVSVYKSAVTAPFLLEEKRAFETMTKQNVLFDDGIKLAKDSVYITVKSGGGNYSKYGSILRNNINVLNSTFGWGMGMAIIDPVTLTIDSANVFQYGFDNTIVRDLARLIDATPDGKIVCMNVIDDGYVPNAWRDTLYNALKKIGASKVTTLGFRQPWLIIGRKGAAPGTVLELKESASYQAILTYDTVFVKNNPAGSFTTPEITATGKWKELSIDAQIPAGADIKTRCIGRKANGAVDTLSYLTFTNNKADLSALNSAGYQSVQARVELTGGTGGASPVLKNLAVYYDGAAELDISSRGVRLSPDTLSPGSTSSLTVAVSNAGDYSADSVKVLVTEEPGARQVDSRIIPSIPAEAKISYAVPYSPGTGTSSRQIQIEADPDKKIKEYYKENNIYSLPVPLRIDSSGRQELRVLFDSLQLFDGEYVSKSPSIRIELSDYSIIKIDTNYVKNNVAFKILLDKNQVMYGTPGLSFTFSDVNPKMVATYKPVLTDGNHTLQVIALSTNLKDTTTVRKSFAVSSQLQLLSVYNYPNPFQDKTNFTFEIPSIPDELTIKIYTVAGRLIKVINAAPPALQIGFNKSITWDGRDEDGDEVANGVYLYRILLKKDDKTVSSLHKLAIVR